MAPLQAEELSALINKENKATLNELGGAGGIAEILDTDTNSGIKSSTVNERKKKYGENMIPVKEIPSVFSLLLEALDDAQLKILILCAFCSMFLEYFFSAPEEAGMWWIDGVAILIAVSIVSIVQAVSNHKQAIQFAEINKCNLIYKVTVKRDNEFQEIDSNDVVVGDIIFLKAGDKIPADGILIEATDLEINTSSLNGESEAVMKTEENPFILSGTLVDQGAGSYIVLAVGSNSNFGRIFNTLNEEQNPTLLQEKLEVLAGDIGYAGMLVATFTFIALTLSWVYIHFRIGWSWAATKDLLDYFVGALTIVVVAVPEGLPLAVTISLAYSMRKMMSDNNFVRHLNACETMGSATVICTDKTGTLTLNQMNVEKAIIGDWNGTIAVKPPESSEISVEFDVAEQLKSDIIRAICTNTSAHVSAHKSIGSQTECAIIRFAQALGADVEEIRAANPISRVFLFDNTRKMMTTVVKSEGRLWSSTKGAPEFVLEKCTKYVAKDGAIYELGKKEREVIERLNASNCSEAYRTLAIACRDFDSVPATVDEAERGLTLLTVVAIRDSLRPSTKDAIKRVQAAGIRVIMITGDNELTASAIANDCGIASDGFSTMCGDTFRELSEAEQEEAISRICVVARSTPLDKYKIVRALQRRGEIVAVTGDGTNDAPALRRAEVGLSMGICGTELAKEASDIVILDDDFKSIVSSVMWGRCIFNNVRRFLQFQLTANVVTLFISFISSVLLHDTPFKAVQLLWVNLIMDSLGALALATSMPHKELLDKPPNSREEALISDYMIQNIGSQSLFQIALLFLVLVFPVGVEPRSVHHYTRLFNVFVYCQVFNLINARVVDWKDSIKTGFFSNPLYLAIMGGIALVQFILVQLCGKFFASVPLSSCEWAFSVISAAICVPYGLVMRSKPIALFSGVVSWANKLTSKLFKRN